MSSKENYSLVHLNEIPWEDRVNVDGWPSRGGMYCQDTDNQLTLRLIDYPVGSIEPRHVHAGTHATTVLKGRAIVDGLTLGPLDVILGPSNEPHGPLQYPEGCKLFSAFYGSYYHSEVEKLSTEKNYRLIQARELPWKEMGQGREVKTLVDHGCGPVLLQVQRFQRGSQLDVTADTALHSALVVEGSAKVGTETLGAWDFMRFQANGEPVRVEFPQGAVLLTVALQ